MGAFARLLPTCFRATWFRHENDFIFAVLSEEFGFIGAVTVTFIFMLFVWRGLHIARHASDLFASLLATGVTTLIGLQAFINIGVVTGLLPTKGITLPFISYGGSSIVLSLVSVGILLNISRVRREPPTNVRQ